MPFKGRFLVFLFSELNRKLIKFPSPEKRYNIRVQGPKKEISGFGYCYMRNGSI